MAKGQSSDFKAFQKKLSFFVEKREKLYKKLSDVFKVDLNTGKSGERKYLFPILYELLEEKQPSFYSTLSDSSLLSEISEVLELRDEILQDEAIDKLLEQIYHYHFVLRGNNWISFNEFRSTALLSLFSVLDRIDTTKSVLTYMSRWIVTDVMREFSIANSTNIHYQFFDDMKKEDSISYLDTLTDDDCYEENILQAIDIKRLIDIALREFHVKDYKKMSFEQKLQVFREKWGEMEGNKQRGKREIEYLVTKIKDCLYS